MLKGENFNLSSDAILLLVLLSVAKNYRSTKLIGKLGYTCRI
jgi:hypothetical protein